MPCAPGPLPPGMVSSWLLTSQTPFHHFRPSFSAISSRRRVQAHEKPSNICGMPEILYSPFSARGTLPVPTAGSAPLRVLPCPPSLGSSSVPHASKACIILFCTHVVKFPRNGPVTWGPSISWPHHFQREASKDSMLVCIQQVGRGRAWRTKSGSYLGNWPGSRHSSGAHVPSWSMRRGTEVSKQTNGFSGQLASLQHRLVHSYDEAEKVLSNG